MSGGAAPSGQTETEGGPRDLQQNRREKDEAEHHLIFSFSAGRGNTLLSFCCCEKRFLLLELADVC